MFCALLTSRYQVSVYRTNGPLVIMILSYVSRMSIYLYSSSGTTCVEVLKFEKQQLDKQVGFHTGMMTVKLLNFRTPIFFSTIIIFVKLDKMASQWRNGSKRYGCNGKLCRP